MGKWVNSLFQTIPSRGSQPGIDKTLKLLLLQESDGGDQSNLGKKLKELSKVFADQEDFEFYKNFIEGNPIELKE